MYYTSQTSSFELVGAVYNLRDIRDIQGKIHVLKIKWLVLTNHFDIAIVFKISVFQISNFNCSFQRCLNVRNLKKTKLRNFIYFNRIYELQERLRANELRQQLIDQQLKNLDDGAVHSQLLAVQYSIKFTKDFFIITRQTNAMTQPSAWALNYSLNNQ